MMVLNSHYDVVDFSLPEYLDGEAWEQLIDTNLKEEAAAYRGRSYHAYGITGRSLVLFVPV